MNSTLKNLIDGRIFYMLEGFSLVFKFREIQYFFIFFSDIECIQEHSPEKM